MEGRNLLAAAEFLHVRAKWLAEGIGPMKDASSKAFEQTVTYLPDHQLDRMTQELLGLFGQLDADGKREYLMHLRGFVAGRRPHQVGDAPAVAGK